MKKKMIILLILIVVMFVLLFIVNRIWQINLTYIFNIGKTLNIEDNSNIKKFIDNPTKYDVKLTGKLDARMKLDISLTDEEKIELAGYFKGIEMKATNDIYYYGYNHKFEFSNGNEKFEFTTDGTKFTITNNFSLQGVDTYHEYKYNSLKPFKKMYYKYWENYLPENYKVYYK